MSDIVGKLRDWYSLAMTFHSVGLGIALAEVVRVARDVIVSVSTDVHNSSLLTLLLFDKDIIVEVSLEDVRVDHGDTGATESVASSSTEKQINHFWLRSAENQSLHAGSSNKTHTSGDLGHSAHVLKFDAHNIKLRVAELVWAVEQLLQFRRHCLLVL